MKKLTAIFVCLLLVASLAVTAFAATPIDVTLDTATKTVKRGDSIELTVSIPEVANLRSGSSALGFDKNVLEFVGGSCTQDKAMLSDVNYNNEVANGVFTYKKGAQPASISGLLFTFQMKVKDDAAFGKTTVTIDTATLKDGDGNVLEVNMGSVELEVVCAEHKYDAGVETTPASCEADGVKTYTCEYCGATKTEAIAKLGHKWDAGTETTPASCEADGVKTYSCDNGCGKTKTEAIAKLGHKWNAGTETTPASCEADGVKTFTCDNGCGKTKTEAIAKLGHKMDAGKVTTPAACETDGVMTYTCENGCGKTETKVIDKLGHKWGEWESVSDTEHKRVCATCQKAETAAHNHDELVAGETTHWHGCVCGAKKDEVAHAHDTTKLVSDENEHWNACACGAKANVAKHNWDEGKVTTAATTKKEGVKTFTCKDCAAEKTESIPKLKTPPMGDNSMILPFILLMVLSAAGVAVTVIGKKRIAR